MGATTLSSQADLELSGLVSPFPNSSVFVLRGGWSSRLHGFVFDFLPILIQDCPAQKSLAPLSNDAAQRIATVRPSRDRHDPSTCLVNSWFLSVEHDGTACLNSARKCCHRGQSAIQCTSGCDVVASQKIQFWCNALLPSRPCICRRLMSPQRRRHQWRTNICTS